VYRHPDRDTDMHPLPGSDDHGPSTIGSLRFDLVPDPLKVTWWKDWVYGLQDQVVDNNLKHLEEGFTGRN